MRIWVEKWKYLVHSIMLSYFFLLTADLKWFYDVVTFNLEWIIVSKMCHFAHSWLV